MLPLIYSLALNKYFIEETKESLYRIFERNKIMECREIEILNTKFRKLSHHKRNFVRIPYLVDNEMVGRWARFVGRFARGRTVGSSSVHGYPPLPPEAVRSTSLRSHATSNQPRLEKELKLP